MHAGPSLETLGYLSVFTAGSQQVLSQEQCWVLSMVLTGTDAMLPYGKDSDVEWSYIMSEQAALLWGGHRQCTLKGNVMVQGSRA